MKKAVILFELRFEDYFLYLAFAKFPTKPSYEKG